MTDLDQETAYEEAMNTVEQEPLLLKQIEFDFEAFGRLMTVYLSKRDTVYRECSDLLSGTSRFDLPDNLCRRLYYLENKFQEAIRSHELAYHELVLAIENVLSPPLAPDGSTGVITAKCREQHLIASAKYAKSKAALIRRKKELLALLMTITMVFASVCYRYVDKTNAGLDEKRSLEHRAFVEMYMACNELSVFLYNHPTFLILSTKKLNWVRILFYLSTLVIIFDWVRIKFF